MAHKTFISYKYDESKMLRNKVIDSLGDDAVYYQGETSDSPDVSDTTTENIKRRLKDMIYETSVTIVIISPNMKKSKWIDWEIEYSLKCISRDNKTSRTNCILGVVMKCDCYGYDWFIGHKINSDGCKIITYNEEYLYPIIRNNRFNQDPPEYACKSCKTVDSWSGSYISFVTEEEFINNSKLYIERTYDKCTRVSDYKICKDR